MKALFIAAIALVSLPTYADDLRVGSMHIEWPVGCRGTTEERTISMECPGGEHVIISPVLARSDIPEQQASVHFLATAQDMSQKVLVPFAEKNGKVIKSLTSAPANNTVVYSTASKGKRLFKEYYLLQYLVTGSGGMVFFTIEGYGSTAEQMARFDSVFTSARFE